MMNLSIKVMLVFIVVSCGGGGGENSASKKNSKSNRNPIEREFKGQYRAVLNSLNNGIAGITTGSATFSYHEDQFIGYVRFSGTQAKVLHTQHVHVGKTCPEKDENQDGIIDAVETHNVVGKILIPLDADLSSQDRGSSIWPVASENGSYHWNQATTLEKIMADLRESDSDPEDDFVKLGVQDKNFDLTGKVIVIYGVPKESALPESAQSRGRLTNFQGLPVACGVFEKITHIPGHVDEDQDLGDAPAGESIGGSSGADDGATVIVDGPSGGGSTGWTTGGRSGL